MPRTGTAASPPGAAPVLRRESGDWPFTEKDGDNWVLETFFVAFGRLQISFLVAHVVDEFDPDDLKTLLAEFDWPRPD